jgi:hypothetical protein
MAVDNTYQAIATTTLASVATSYSFTSIPATYTDLVLVLNSIANSTAFHIYAQFNSDTAANYSQTILYGTGTSAASTRETSQNQARYSYGAAVRTTSPTTTIITIFNYANTTTYKTSIARNNRASDGVDAIVSLWRKTPEAINNIQIYNSAGANFAIGSTFTLYGIKAA